MAPEPTSPFFLDNLYFLVRLYKLLFNYISTLLIIEGGPTYPATVTVSSTGGAADQQGPALGVYQRTGQTHSGRPVWQNTVRPDRFLLYNGNN